MAPAAGELEGVGEEAAVQAPARARRADTGGFVIGQKREKRFIEPSKYWRVDDKERNKKRKLMTTKMWKGRKKPKLKSLTAEEEVYLAEFIRNKESSSEEDSGDEEVPRAKRLCVWGVERSATSSQSSVEEEGCVWSAVEGAEVQEVERCQVPGSREGGECSREAPQTRAEARAQDEVVEAGAAATSRPVVEAREVEQTETRFGELVDAEVTEVAKECKEKATRPVDKPVEAEAAEARMVEARMVEARLAEVDDSLASLVGLIPAEELEEMMSGDLLFCGEGGGEGRRAKKGKGARESKGGVRRSAMLSTHPSLPSLPYFGSIYTMEEAEVGEEEVFEEARVITPPPIAPPAQGDTPPFLNQVAPLRVAGKSKTKSRLKVGRAGAGVLQDISNKENMARTGGEERLQGKGGMGRVLEGRGKDSKEKGGKATKEEKNGSRGSGEGGSRRSR